MAPGELEIVGFRKIRHTFFARDIRDITCAYASGELVAEAIAALRFLAPRAVGVDITGEVEIYIIVDSEVIAEALQIHTARLVITKIRHD